MSAALNIPFPNKLYYDNTVIVLNIPVNTLNGINYVGMTSLLLLVVSLFFLVKSMKKYHVRTVLITIIVSVFLPSLLITTYQKTFASGIYAISYANDQSNCHFKMINRTTLHAECELPLKNYSRNDVQFNLTFYSFHMFEDDVQMVSLMNNNAPYKVSLKAKESKRVKIETNIDVSKMKNHIDSGEVNGGVDLFIESEGKTRRL